MREEKDEKLEKEKAQLREDIRNMTPKQKLGYFLDYYKWVLVMAGIGIFLIIGGIDWYKNSKIDTVLNIAVVGGGLSQDNARDLVEEDLGIAEDRYEQVLVLSPFSMDQNGQLDYYSQISLVTRIQAQDLDILFMPKDFALQMAEQDYFEDVSGLLGEAGIELPKGEAGTEGTPYMDANCLVLPGSEYLQKFGAYMDPVYAGVFVNSKNLEYASRWISILYEKAVNSAA